MIELTLYGRAYCHLCDDMAVALEPMREQFGFTLRIEDVDASAALEQRYGEWVPVLAHGEVELCHYFLDTPRVHDYLTAQGRRQTAQEELQDDLLRGSTSC